MDSSGLVVDQQPVYPRRGGNMGSNGGMFPPPRSQSMTPRQQQQLLKILNAHAGAGAGGLGFLGARGDGQMVQQQHVIPQSYAASPPLISSPHPPPSSHHLPPRPAYSSLPAPQLVHQQSHPPLLPLPFSRSSSLPSPGPARAPRNKPGQSAVARPAKEQQQKNRAPGKVSTATPTPTGLVAKPKKVDQASATPAKADVAKQTNVPVVLAAESKKLQSDEAVQGAAAAASPKETKGGGGIHRLPELQQLTGIDHPSPRFSVYSLAPDPSSLPLPRLITLRPKGAVAIPAASCNAEAVLIGGADAGEGPPGAIHEDLRRLLRL